LNNYSVPTQIDEYFTKLAEVGITPIITHPERNPFFRRPRSGCCDGGSGMRGAGHRFGSDWSLGQKAARAADWLFERDAVHVLATDAHDTKHRIPALSAARGESGQTLRCGPRQGSGGQQSTRHRQR